MTRDDIQTRLQALYSKAKTEGRVEYLYTLVRVDGVTNTPDPFIAFRALLAQGVEGLSDEEVHQHCLKLADSTEALSFLGNLLVCAARGSYRPDVFDDLYTGRETLGVRHGSGIV